VSISRSFGVIIFSDLAPRRTSRLAARIQKEVPEARVCGILYPQQSQRSSSNPTGGFLGASGEASLLGHPDAEEDSLCFKGLAKLGSILLRFIHACPAQPNGPTRFGLNDLARFCEALGCPLLVTTGPDSAEAGGFVRKLGADLGIVYGTTLPHSELHSIPRHGSLRLHEQRMPGCPSDGPAELRESLEAGEELRVSVHRVGAEHGPGLTLCSESFPIEPFDTLTSVSLKSDLVGNDLLVSAVAGLIRGTLAKERSEPVLESRGSKRLAGHQSEIAPRHLSYRVKRSRPRWKLLLRTLLLGPYVVVRNWVRRFRGSFPVIILYHHLVADRPHYNGIPTQLFLRQAKFLREHYKVVSLSEAVEMLRSNRVKAPTVVLTFDDGYRDNFISLRAVTEVTGIPATLLVCTENVDLQREFDYDLKLGVRNFWPLTWDQIEYLNQAGFEIGSHTRLHFDCGSSDIQGLQREIVGSKADLEHHLGIKVRFFSFPWGHPVNMSEEALQLARVTYPYVCSAFGGGNFPSRDPQLWHLRRVSHPNDIWELELALQSVLDF
jgi:peptidoglycan/xylan/chitin deacetylase (PgdA/CDA1 family)